MAKFEQKHLINVFVYMSRNTAGLHAKLPLPIDRLAAVILCCHISDNIAKLFPF